MPGWHEATVELQKQGRVKVVGIIPEQHSDRTRLFMQWKQMDWPILVDPYNLLAVTAVPITLFIDEFGIVRQIRPRHEEVEDFLAQTYPPPSPSTQEKPRLPDLSALKQKTRQDTAESWRAYGGALGLWGQDSQVGDAIAAYDRALEKEPDHGPTHFHLGVSYRKRYDSDYRQAGDFQNAVSHWGKALDIDPNQYIWRRRIQQYGPRLDKPYSFYDWVNEARREIAARGEVPAELSVEPGGAEFAYPSEDFQSVKSETKEPDPGGRIFRDREEFVKVETITVPSRVAPGESGRMHLVFRPNLNTKAHWNNEVEDLVVWVDPPAGWQVDRQHLTVSNPPQVVSQETRKVEFEFYSPEHSNASATIPAYALYYVCEDVNGTCLYRRQDVSVEVQVTTPTQ